MTTPTSPTPRHTLLKLKSAAGNSDSRGWDGARPSTTDTFAASRLASASAFCFSSALRTAAAASSAVERAVRLTPQGMLRCVLSLDWQCSLQCPRRRQFTPARIPAQTKAAASATQTIIAVETLLDSPPSLHGSVRPGGREGGGSRLADGGG